MRLRDDDITWQDVDGQVVVLDLRSSLYLELNQSASALFALVARGSDAPALALALAERYGLPADDAERDAAAFVQMLAEHGLLED